MFDGVSVWDWREFSSCVLNEEEAASRFSSCRRDSSQKAEVPSKLLPLTSLGTEREDAELRESRGDGPTGRTHNA